MLIQIKANNRNRWVYGRQVLPYRGVIFVYAVHRPLLLLDISNLLIQLEADNLPDVPCFFFLLQARLSGCTKEPLLQRVRDRSAFLFFFLITVLLSLQI